MSNGEPLQDHSPRSKSHSIRAYVSDLICNVSSDEEFDARKIMQEKPEVLKYRSLVLDLAYEEFCRKQENGDAVQQQSFAKRFPDYEESLLRVLQVHQYLEQVEEKKEKSHWDWPKPGDTFGDYRLLELIGRGSFAFVFLAEQLSVAERQVVLKITRNAFDEVSTLGKLNHPNIVQIFTVESDLNGFTAICMPLISRVTLFDVLGELHGYGSIPGSATDFVDAMEFCANEREGYRLDRERLPFRRGDRFVDAVIRVGVDIAKALSYSHKQKVLHCDIKPTNILIAPSGRSMLFDFNLSANTNSKTGRIGGTMPYMPPEQLKALVDPNYQFEASPALDIYSLGVTLYQLLTGRLPFGDLPESATQKESALLLLERQKHCEISLTGIKGLNPSFKKLIKSCLAFDPNDRPSSAASLVRKLESEQQPVKRSRRWIISHPVLALCALVLLFGTIPGLMWGHKYVTQGLPTQKINHLIKQGKDAESIDQFNHAIAHYQNALKLADFNPKLRYQILCRLAVVYARDGQPENAKAVSKVLREDFPKDEIASYKLRLPVLACDEQIKDDHYLEAYNIVEFLANHDSYSLDDKNNFFSLLLRYRLSEKIDVESLESKFREVLEEQPKHVASNFNLFRLAWNRDRKKDIFDDRDLLKCLRISGDHPIMLSFLFKNAAASINNGRADLEEYFSLLDRYVDCGGNKAKAVSFGERLKDPLLRSQYMERVEELKFEEKEFDRFIFFGIANPIESFDF